MLHRRRSSDPLWIRTLVVESGNVGNEMDAGKHEKADNQTFENMLYGFVLNIFSGINPWRRLKPLSLRYLAAPIRLQRRVTNKQMTPPPLVFQLLSLAGHEHASGRMCFRVVVLEVYKTQPLETYVPQCGLCGLCPHGGKRLQADPGHFPY